MLRIKNFFFLQKITHRSLNTRYMVTWAKRLELHLDPESHKLGQRVQSLIDQKNI